MKLWVAAALLLASCAWPSHARSLDDAAHAALVQRQSDWIDALAKCESSGNPQAVNPRDRDGTPSYGLLQFKPSTFSALEKKYGVKGDLLDPAAQRAIVEAMINDPDFSDHELKYRQFPDCIQHHIGLPPRK